METTFLPDAMAEFVALDSAALRRVAKKIAWLAQNAETTDHIQLSGELSHLFKLRAGDYRILYQLREDAILIHAIGHRREIYD